MSEQNKELVRQFVKAWGAGDLDAFGDLLSADLVDHNAMPGTAPGLEGAKQAARMTRAAFPDMTDEIHNIIAEGDLVAMLATVRGTHEGEIMGMPPTGKSFAITAIDVIRVAGGKMVERWGLTDQAGMMTQLGLAPLPPGAEGWTPPQPGPAATMSGTGDPQAHRASMTRMIDEMRAGNIEEIMTGIGSNVIDHAALPGQPPGKAGVRWRFEQLFGGMSHVDFQVVASVAEGPFLSQAYTFSAKHTGTMMGMPATNKSFEISATDFVWFDDDGLFREHWGLIDVPSMMGQLGLMPPPS
jgi:steroid delta-isomerase-like uncharacterized protein